MKPLCEEDDVDMFFKSIAMTAKKMSPLAMKKAKLRTLNLISEINDKYSTPQTAQTLLYITVVKIGKWWVCCILGAVWIIIINYWSVQFESNDRITYDKSCKENILEGKLMENLVLTTHKEPCIKLSIFELQPYKKIDLVENWFLRKNSLAYQAPDSIFIANKDIDFGETFMSV
ncbi:BESS domain-containing protein [Aphis craccivora]|uniref:BESS domain-containing protein n=1 Tax=Aphis craccivora TaxID=307492 RepID=A0A6G0YI83_APHCR|nr:BESS domain-containing protein [Aphis craccivora]